MPTVIGRKLSPVRSASWCRTCCRNSDRKNHMANTADPSRNTTTLADRNRRRRKIDSGTSGAAARRPSTAAKATSIAAPSAIGPRTPSVPQPRVSDCTIP